VHRTPSQHAAREGVACDLPYAEWPGAEPAIVLVPGIFATQRALSGLAAALSPSRRVFAFDLRGRGRAPLGGPFGIDRHARDLWGAIDELGLQAPVLAGHSLGAFVVAVAAGSRPQAASAVVLLDGGLWSPAGVPVELVHAIFADDRSRLTRSFADVAEYAMDRGIEPTPAVLHELAYELAASGEGLAPRMPVEAFDEDVASIAAEQRRNGLLAAAGCPVLVVRALQGVGGNPLAQMIDDQTRDAARAEIPSLHVVDLAEAAHGTVIRMPFAERVAAEILAFTA
jgi:lipase